MFSPACQIAESRYQSFGLTLVGIKPSYTVISEHWWAESFTQSIHRKVTSVCNLLMHVRQHNPTPVNRLSALEADIMLPIVPSLSKLLLDICTYRFQIRIWHYGPALPLIIFNFNFVRNTFDLAVFWFKNDCVTFIWWWLHQWWWTFSLISIYHQKRFLPKIFTVLDHHYESASIFLMFHWHLKFWFALNLKCWHILLLPFVNTLPPWMVYFLLIHCHATCTFGNCFPNLWGCCQH